MRRVWLVYPQLPRRRLAAHRRQDAPCERSFLLGGSPHRVLSGRRYRDRRARGRGPKTIMFVIAPQGANTVRVHLHHPRDYGRERFLLRPGSGPGHPVAAPRSAQRFATTSRSRTRRLVERRHVVTAPALEAAWKARTGSMRRFSSQYHHCNGGFPFHPPLARNHRVVLSAQRVVEALYDHIDL